MRRISFGQYFSVNLRVNTLSFHNIGRYSDCLLQKKSSYTPGRPLKSQTLPRQMKPFSTQTSLATRCSDTPPNSFQTKEVYVTISTMLN